MYLPTSGFAPSEVFLSVQFFNHTLPARRPLLARCTRIGVAKSYVIGVLLLVLPLKAKSVYDPGGVGRTRTEMKRSNRYDCADGRGEIGAEQKSRTYRSVLPEQKLE